MRHDDGLLPKDPEYDNTPLGASIEGVSTMAKLLGRLRRELRAEGFTKVEAYTLCEKWLEAAADRLAEEDE
jgi:hypothetical protein